MDFLSHFAYLDPGTGSLIIQSIIGGLAGVIVFGRRHIMAAKYKVQSKFGKKPEAASPIKSDDNTPK